MPDAKTTMQWVASLVINQGQGNSTGKKRNYIACNLSTIPYTNINYYLEIFILAFDYALIFFMKYI